MLKKKHLSSTKILKSQFCGLLKKRKLDEIFLKMPSTKEELFDRILLCSKLAEFSYSYIPRVLEACKDKVEIESSTLYLLSTLRRNVYQGHKLKDAYLLESLSRGYATVKYSLINSKKSYLVIDFDGYQFIVRVKSFYLNKYKVPLLEEKPSLTGDVEYSDFENLDEYYACTKVIRNWYVLWHDAMVSFNKKIVVHNQVYLELLPMVKQGQIKLVDSI